jgi:hypothetical protein
MDMDLNGIRRGERNIFYEKLNILVLAMPAYEF